MFDDPPSTEGIGSKVSYISIVYTALPPPTPPPVYANRGLGSRMDRRWHVRSTKE